MNRSIRPIFLTMLLLPPGDNTLRDFVHAPFELLKLVGLKISTHDAETVANPGADVTRARAI